MPFVDVWIVAVPDANKQKYIEQCKKMGPAFKEHGALSVTDCWGADVPDGKLTSLPMAVKKKEDETVALGYAVWPDKATRDAGIKAVMSDPRMSENDMNAIFDGARVIFGGFEVANAT